AAVSASTRFDIPCDLHDANLPPGWNATLVKGKPVELLGTGAVKVLDVDHLVGHDHAVGGDLDLLQLIRSDVLVVPDIEPRALQALLRSCLVDVRSEDLL